MNRWAIFGRPLRGLACFDFLFPWVIDTDLMVIIGAMNIELKGLSPKQVNNLLPDGLISLCWRGSVAHGMYVPKTDPDSIDDKDIMGIYVAEREHYLGFGRKDVYESWEGEWGCVFYELRKMIGLLLNCNPNVLSLL